MRSGDLIFINKNSPVCGICVGVFWNICGEFRVSLTSILTNRF